MVTVNSDGKRGNNMSEKIESQTVTMAHGAGGKQTSELIDKVFAAHFANPDLTADDAAVLNPPVGKMAVYLRHFSREEILENCQSAEQ